MLCLAHDSGHNEKIVTTDAWQRQSNSELKPTTIRTMPKSTPSVNWNCLQWSGACSSESEQFRIHPYGKALEPLLKKNWNKKLYSARLTRRLDISNNKLLLFYHLQDDRIRGTEKNLRRRICHQRHRATRKGLCECDRIFNQSEGENANKTDNKHDAK